MRRKKEVMEVSNIRTLRDALNKKYGVGTALLGSDVLNTKIEFYSTGSYALDISLKGGFPYNRMVELIGEESSCKTSQLHISAQSFLADNPNGYVVHCDLENSLDFSWMRRLGCDLSKNYLFVYADSGEQAGDIVDDVIADRTLPVMIIIDSIMALVPMIELESTMDSQFMGKQPQLINRIIRVANSRLKAARVGGCARTSLLLVNQTRPVIGGSPYQNPITSSGGQGRKFFCSQRIVFSSQTSVDKEERGEGDNKHTLRIGKRVHYQVIKNKCGGSEETGHFLFYNRAYNDIPVGVDNASALINGGLLFNVLSRVANSILYGKMKLGGSADAAKQTLRENKPMMLELREKILSAARADFTGEPIEYVASSKGSKSTSSGRTRRITLCGKSSSSKRE